MNFIISGAWSAGWKVSITKTGDTNPVIRNNFINLGVDVRNDAYCQIVHADEKIFCLIGDFIIPELWRTDTIKFLKDYFSDFSIEKLRGAKGNFYLIIIDEKSQQIKITSSMMSILPLYYFISDAVFMVSSRADSIVKQCNTIFKVNNTYILEHLLFGYSLQDSTIFRGIKLLPVNSYFEINGIKSSIWEHTRVADYFVSTPVPWQESLEALSDMFIDRAKDYFPDEPYFSSFTGGLDSRTILALGLSVGGQITAYSYGGSDDKDVYIPGDICKKINVPYQPFILNENYARQMFFQDAQEANQITEGMLRFSRATYLFMSREISKVSNYMLSGNFGSELLRTARMSGNVISETAFEIFESISDKELAHRIKNSPRFKYLHLSAFQHELEDIIEKCLDYRKRSDKLLLTNQRFYQFMFEEVFRKYFGAEIVLENQYLINRTPFLDFGFFAEILKSEFAGCNTRFRASNPFDRFVGQALYPSIIKKTYPLLLKYKLDREYSPGDFLSGVGRIRIACGYLRRKIYKDRNRYHQPEYNRIAMDLNMSRIDPATYDLPFVKMGLFSSLLKDRNNSSDYINLNIYLSLLDYLSQIRNKLGNVTF